MQTSWGAPSGSLVMGCFLLPGMEEGRTPSQRETYALFLGTDGEEGRELSVSVDSQLPATQNILMAKWNILEWAYPDPFHIHL